MESGYWFHFWLDGTRPTIDPADIGAALTTYEAKVIKDNPKGADNTAKADYVASSGADWYLKFFSWLPEPQPELLLAFRAHLHGLESLQWLAGRVMGMRSQCLPEWCEPCQFDHRL